MKKPIGLHGKPEQSSGPRQPMIRGSKCVFLAVELALALIWALSTPGAAAPSPPAVPLNLPLDTGCASVAASAHGWQCEAAVLTPFIVPHGSIWLKLSARNGTGLKKRQPYLAPLNRAAAFELTTEDGQRIYLREGHADFVGGKPYAPNHSILEPNEVHIGYLDLMSIVAAEKYGIPYLPRAKYTLKIDLFPEVLDGVAPEQCRVALPPLQFEVRSVSGDTAEALELYRSAWRSFDADKSKAIDLFRRVKNEFRQTPYAELAALGIIDALKWTPDYDPSNSGELLMEFYADFPESFHNIWVLGELIRTGHWSEVVQHYESIKANPRAVEVFNYVKESCAALLSSGIEK